MPNNAETSILDAADSVDRNIQNGVLRNRLGDATDHDEAKKAKVNETTIETPITPGKNAELGDDVEYVKGHPVIKTGERYP